MNDDFHAVKLAAAHATLMRYGLSKTAAPGDFLKATGNVLRHGGLGGAVGATLGGITGFIEGPNREDGQTASLKDRLINAGRMATISGAAGGAIGLLGGQAASNREALKKLFTFDPGGRLLRQIPREMIFGSPLTLMRQHKVLAQRAAQAAGRDAPIAADRLRALGQGYKNYFWTKPTSWVHAAGNLFGLGMSGLDLYRAAQTEDPNVRRGDIASAAAGIAAAPLFGRLGLPGALAHTAVREGARRLFQKNAPTYAPAYEPDEHLRLALKSLGTYSDPDAYVGDVSP